MITIRPTDTTRMLLAHVDGPLVLSGHVDRDEE